MGASARRGFSPAAAVTGRRTRTWSAPALWQSPRPLSRRPKTAQLWSTDLMTMGALVRRRCSRAAAMAPILKNPFVGGHEQFVRHGETEHSGGRGVDDQLELTRLQHRQLRRLRALKDAAGIDADLTKRIGNVGSVGDQPADFGI